MNKQLTRRSFIKTSVAATIFGGASNALFGTEPINRQVRYEPNVGRRTYGVIEPDAPLTLPQAPLSPVARTMNEATKASLVIWGPSKDKNGGTIYGYQGTSFQADFPRRKTLLTANHVWKENFKIEAFTIIDYRRTKIALCRGRKGVDIRRILESRYDCIPKADRTIVIPGNVVYLDRRSGDMTVIELPCDGIPGVPCLKQETTSALNASLYVLGTSNPKPEKRQSWTLAETIKDHFVRARRCYLRDANYVNEDNFRALKLQTATAEEDEVFVRGDSGAPIVSASGGLLGMMIQLHWTDEVSNWPDGGSSPICVATTVDDVSEAVARRLG